MGNGENLKVNIPGFGQVAFSGKGLVYLALILGAIGASHYYQTQIFSQHAAVLERLSRGMETQAWLLSMPPNSRPLLRAPPHVLDQMSHGDREKYLDALRELRRQGVPEVQRSAPAR